MGPTRPNLYEVGSSRTWFVLLGSDLVFLCPGSGQESREVLAVALPVRQFAEHILHPCSRVDPCSPAGAYEGVYDGCPICGGVVADFDVFLISGYTPTDFGQQAGGYRDAVTEGYNFTPNFFLSAIMPDTLTYSDIAYSGR